MSLELENVEELQTILRQPAFSLEEKIRVLNARDKLQRLNLKKETNIKKAKAVHGTCQDMCPEYERYCREDRSLLSIYELSHGLPDEHKMVKEYRRSGADQHEPLPHELRPPAVLERTMTYLLCNIIDLILQDDEQVADWYDFLWSRTRAIRKDIGQQHMCDLSAVHLMEKCARFHIFCAHYLCEQDPSVFDQKINNENLTKCIQSLKEFYDDLWLRRVACNNEAEFRCYELLLNLNDGDSLRSTKHLRPDIRQSAPVRFAMKVQFALATNNSVRFFKLVQQTTYLNACILHRYFGQVRSQAVNLLRRACTLSNQRELFPRDQLARQLRIENLKELEDFCQAVSLSSEDGFVILYKNDTVHANPKGARSNILIESKRGQATVGQLVNGGPLPPNPVRLYPLHYSFDDEGKLQDERVRNPSKFAPTTFILPDGQLLGQKPPGELGLFGNKTNTFTFGKPTSEVSSFIQKPEQDKSIGEGQFLKPAPVAAPAFSFTSTLAKAEVLMPPPPPPPIIDEKLVEQLTQQIFFELIDTISRSKLEKFVKSIQVSRTAAFFTEQLCAEIAESSIRRMANVAIREHAEKVRQAQELERMVNHVSAILGEQLVSKAAEELLLSNGRAAYTELLEGYVTRKASALTKQLLDRTVSNLCVKTVQSNYSRLREIQQRNIAQMCHKRSWRLAKNCFLHWLKKYKEAKYARKIRDTFPASSIRFSQIKRRSLPQPTYGGEKVENLELTKNATQMALLKIMNMSETESISEDATSFLTLAEKKIANSLSTKVSILKDKFHCANKASNCFKHFLDATEIINEVTPIAQMRSTSP